jgi:hypothetical protein
VKKLPLCNTIFYIQTFVDVVFLDFAVLT